MHIEMSWERLRAKLLNDDADPKAVETLRFAFFMGALAFCDAIVESEEGETDAILDAMTNELNHFTAKAALGFPCAPAGSGLVN